MVIRCVVWCGDTISVEETVELPPGLAADQVPGIVDELRRRCRRVAKVVTGVAPNRDRLFADAPLAVSKG